MAAIVSSPPVDHLYERFKHYVIQRSGARNVTEKAVHAAYEADCKKPYGRELLHRLIDEHERQRDKPLFSIFEGNAVEYEFSGTWRSNAVGFYLEKLYSRKASLSVSATFPGAMFHAHPQQEFKTNGNNMRWAEADEQYLSGPLRVEIQTFDSDPCGHITGLEIRWYRGPQQDMLVAAFTLEEFPYKFDGVSVSEESVWTAA